MSRWFRHYAGMMRDDKLVRVAIKSKQPIERVLWIWGAILESAAEVDDNGRYDLDAAEVAYFLRADEDDIGAVLAGLGETGRVADNRVVHWGDRQFSSDRSKDRQAAYRERQKNQVRHGDSLPEAPNDGVTSLSRHGDAPETETELDTEGSGAKAPSPARARAKRSSSSDVPIPNDWKPNLGVEGLKIVDGWPPGQVEREAFAFRNHALANGRLQKNWDAAFCTWITKSNVGKHQNGRSNQVIPIRGNQSDDRRSSLAKACDEALDYLG